MVKTTGRIEATCDGKVLDMDPCQKCVDLMKQGVIFITIDPTKSDPGWKNARLPNPYRTGGFAVMKDEAVERIFGPDSESAIKHRWAFIEHAAADAIGFFAPENQKA